MADVQVINKGSLIGFRPLTDEANEWFDNEVDSQGWQWLGQVLYVDVRYAGGLAIALEDAGFSYAPL